MRIYIEREKIGLESDHGGIERNGEISAVARYSLMVRIRPWWD
mgnify:CR=1 FL=1